MRSFFRKKKCWAWAITEEETGSADGFCIESGQTDEDLFKKFREEWTNGVALGPKTTTTVLIV